MNHTTMNHTSWYASIIVLIILTIITIPMSATPYYHPPQHFPSPNNCSYGTTYCQCFAGCECAWWADRNYCDAAYCDSPPSPQTSCDNTAFYQCYDDADNAEDACWNGCATQYGYTFETAPYCK